MNGKLLSIVMVIAAIAVQQTVAVPHPNRTVPHQSHVFAAPATEATSNPFYYTAWWFAPSGSVVTGFDSIMKIPKLSSNTQIGVSYPAKRVPSVRPLKIYSRGMFGLAWRTMQRILSFRMLLATNSRLGSGLLPLGTSAKGRISHHWRQ